LLQSVVTSVGAFLVKKFKNVLTRMCFGTKLIKGFVVNSTQILTETLKLLIEVTCVQKMFWWSGLELDFVSVNV
jgi:hypothetical protein